MCSNSTSKAGREGEEGFYSRRGDANGLPIHRHPPLRKYGPRLWRWGLVGVKEEWKKRNKKVTKKAKKNKQTRKPPKNLKKV